MKEIREKLFNDYVTMNGGDIISAEGGGEPEQEPEQGEVLYANSCSLGDVQAAIAIANPGDTVVVPNGTAVWNSQLIITKGIILKAQSKGGVKITSGYSYSSGDILDTLRYLIVYNPTSPINNEPFRITGFVFDLDNKIAWLTIKNLGVIPINKIRLDNNTIRNYRSLLMHLWGNIYGVMDNNVVEGGVSWGLIRINGDENTTWNDFTFEYGTADNFYFEDNNFTVPDDTMFFYGDMGGRYCARYNQIRLSNPQIGLYPFADMHGNIPNVWSGTMGAEVYENTIDTVSKGCDVMDIRGGKGLIYNNKVTTSSNDFFVQIREEHDDSLGPGPAHSPISGQPQHVSDSYFWGNRRNDSYSPRVELQTLDYGEPEGVVPREDVHYWIEKDDFTGESGIGVGTLAQRPETCNTEGVGWWATDENKLYRWHDDAWELYYTPYTYPHPLTVESGGETPPPPPPPAVVPDSKFFDLSDSIGASIIIHAKGENELADGDITFIFSFYKPGLGGVWSFVDSDPYVISLNGINDVCATFVIPYNVKKIQLKSIEYDDDETNSALVNVSLNKLCFDNFEQADSLVSSLKAVINEQKRPKV